MRLEFGPPYDPESTRPEAVVLITMKAFEDLWGVGKMLKTENPADLYFLTSYASHWSISHAFQGHELLAVHPKLTRGIKFRSPLLELARGTEAKERVIEAYAAQKIKDVDVPLIGAPLDSEMADFLVDAEGKTGIWSFDIHFNHGIVYLKNSIAFANEGWILSAYDAETTRNNLLVFPQLENDLSDEERTTAFGRIDKWDYVPLPLAT